MKKFIIALAAAAGVASCAAVNNVLDSKEFNLVELNGTVYESMGETPASISFQEGRCNATVGGNSIFSNYKEGKDGAITFSEGGMTKMLVPDEYREDEFVAALNSVVRFAVEDGTICMSNAEGVVVIKAVSK